MMVCAVCFRKAPMDFGLSFPELVGGPFICSRCVFRALSRLGADDFRPVPDFRPELK